MVSFFVDERGLTGLAVERRERREELRGDGAVLNGTSSAVRLQVDERSG